MGASRIGSRRCWRRSISPPWPIAASTGCRRAISTRPKLLLLDEPVANLDPLWQLRLMDYLRNLARTEGSALLVAMHDLELARIYADRLIIMQDGAIAADGESAELLDGPHIPAIFGIEKKDGAWRPV